MQLTFSGKTALLAGGSCTMALDLARLLVDEGLSPVLTYRSAQGLDTITEALGDLNGRYRTTRLDFSEPDTLPQALDALAPSLDYLVDFIQEDYETLVASLDTARTARLIGESVAVRADFLKQATRRMIRQKFGRLVFVSSAAALRPSAGQGLYAAAKLAAEALYRNIALEMGGFGITTVCLRPGFVAAGRGLAFIEKNRDRLQSAIPGRRWLSSAEVARSLLFLLSDEARGFNATELVMDGGLSAGKPMGGTA
jgi:3-oxoacyl-[acyl-carrier protein] reductase